MSRNDVLKSLESQPRDFPTLVINIFGGPGAGKTVAALAITSELKKKGYTAEYVSEYPKDLIYRVLKGDMAAADLLDGSLEHQKEIHREQGARIERLRGLVDFVVTDSPSILCIAYIGDDDKEKAADFKAAAFDAFAAENNFNVIKKRGSKYQSEGRLQNPEQAAEKDREVLSLLEEAMQGRKKKTIGRYTHGTADNITTNAIKVYEARKKQVITDGNL